MDKALWEKSFGSVSIEQLPQWPCPECATGKLVIVKDSIYFRRAVKQYDPNEFKKEDFENSILLGILKVLGTAAEMLLREQARFSAFLSCNECGENVAVCGRAEVPSNFSKELYKKSKTSQDTLCFIIPEYFTPQLPIFSLRKEYPKEINRELAKSFSMFFSDSSAAGNKLRTCIEILLDTQNIPNNNSLHQRIVEFQQKNSDLGKMLLAVKWVGNEASHTPDIEKKDLLAAYEIIEFILMKIFVDSVNANRLMHLSQKLESQYKNP